MAKAQKFTTDDLKAAFEAGKEYQQNWEYYDMEVDGKFLGIDFDKWIKKFLKKK